MKFKNKYSLLTVLVCLVLSGCSTKIQDGQANIVQHATGKHAIDALNNHYASSAEDFSHLVRDGRFLSGNLPIHKKNAPSNKKKKPDKFQFKQEGYASWYASLFHGRKTSSGVEYDEYEYSAAHRTLPIPSVVKVTNLQNKKSVTVVVNDRGPFKGGKKRIIDLSRQAADDLDMIDKGTVKVKIELLVDETKELIAHLNPSEQKKAKKAFNKMIH